MVKFLKKHLLSVKTVQSSSLRVRAKKQCSLIIWHNNPSRKLKTGIFCQKARQGGNETHPFLNMNFFMISSHTSYLSQTPQTCLCKNFLSGVNFSRMSEKKCIYMTFSETFLVFLVILVVFLGVKYGFRKSCLCQRNDKYEVCIELYIIAQSINFKIAY